MKGEKIKESVFKDKVFDIVSKISKGKTLSYKQVAVLADSSQAFRAVGNILAKNKDKKIPCHRVIRSDFSVGGFQGSKNNSNKKRVLLLKENAKIKVITKISLK